MGRKRKSSHPNQEESGRQEVAKSLNSATAAQSAKKVKGLASHTLQSSVPQSRYHHMPVIVVGVCCMIALLMQRFYYLPKAVNLTHDPAALEDAYFRLGLSAAAVTMVTIGGIYFPNTLLTRPHPAIWRMMLSMGLLYTLGLVFVLFQGDNMPYKMIKWLDPTVPDQLPEKAYAEDCRLFTEDNWFHFLGSCDSFVAAHFFGYVVKMIILRDWRLVTCVSVGFEIVEITFQHVLPNFMECWWDHLLLDVLLCNGGGTLVGAWLLKSAHAMEYCFISKTKGQEEELQETDGHKKRGRNAIKRRGTNGERGILGRLYQGIVCSIFPEQVELYEWNVFQSFKRFTYVSLLLVLVLIQDTNTFTSKAMLKLDPEHPFVTARMSFWALLSVPAVREYYEFMVNPKVTTLGTTACITILGMAVECVLLTRMIRNGGYFVEPLMPLHVVLPWMVAIASFVIWISLYFTIVTPAKRRCAREALTRSSFSAVNCSTVTYRLTSLVINSFFYLACAALVALFLMGLPDLQFKRQEFESWMEPYAPQLLFWR